jgi:hypothetical protein
MFTLGRFLLPSDETFRRFRSQIYVLVSPIPEARAGVQSTKLYQEPCARVN